MRSDWLVALLSPQFCDGMRLSLSPRPRVSVSARSRRAGIASAARAISMQVLRTSGLTWLGGLCLLAGCVAARPLSAEVNRCEVVNTFPHDTNAFTQGLAYCDGELYEGTGLNGRSSIRRVELATGRVLQQRDLPWRYFGEGITLWGDKLIQLTWTSRTGFLYDRGSFRLLSSFSYPTQGWGLTHDDTRFIMSDGSATLCFRDPDTFAEIGRIRVTDGGGPISNLNELEFIRGEIWANVWRRYAIARISPASGQVLSWIDISGLLSPLERLLAGSPNGIAYDARTDRIFVTGKRWPKVFDIRVGCNDRSQPGYARPPRCSSESKGR